MVLLLLLTAVFFLCWFNRFAGIRSGAGELAGGLSILQGKVAYRDYFNPGPPLNALKSALLMKLFGRSLFVLRSAAVGERLFIVAMLYRWLRRLVPDSSAWIASFTTIVVSAGDRTDPLTSYNHDAVLFGIAAAMCLDTLSCPRSHGKTEFRNRLALFAAGALTSLSALTKQTVGAGCAAFFLLWIVLFFQQGPRKPSSIAGAVAAFLAGLLTPAAFVSLWLWRNHALMAWLHMNLVDGPAAKAGSPLDFLWRTLLVAYDNVGWIILGTFFFALSLAPLLRFARSKEQAACSSSPGLLWPSAIAFAFALAVAISLDRTGLPTLHDQGKSAVYYMLLSLVLICWLLLRSGQFNSATSSAKMRPLLFAGTGLTTAAMLSLSWPAFEAMLLPGLALPVALALTSCRPWPRRCVVVLLACAIYLQTREKLDLPFGFDYQVEAPVRHADTRSQLPLLRDEILPASTVRFLDETTHLIQHCARPHGTVLTYPEMGLVYSLSGTTPPTLSPSHNIDVVNDAFARREAERLLAHPPQVLVYYPETETQAEDAERLWRRGRPAGQRSLVHAIEGLLPQYSLVQTYQLRPGNPGIAVYLHNSGKSQGASCR